MKYFEKHLKMTDSAEDIDISVHCDIKIFEWLMSYLTESGPRLEISNVIPILISADFLVMARLIDDWVRFIVKNLTEVIKIPVDMGCLSLYVLKSISKAVTVEELDACKDPKDSLQSKLFTHKLDEILKEESNSLNLWMYWNTLFTPKQLEWMVCPRAEIFIDYRGRVLANHVADSDWNINEFFAFITTNGVSWRRIFWKVWARLKFDSCLTCGQKFTYSEIDNWTYHPSPPVFSYGSNIGKYECWGSEALRFTTHGENKGWKSRSHLPKLLKESSLDYKFILKHKDLFVESVNWPEVRQNDTKDVNTIFKITKNFIVLFLFSNSILKTYKINDLHLNK